MSMNQLLQALNYLPQIVDKLKKMDKAEKEDFISKLDLQGEEKEDALKILSRFQKGETLLKEEQMAAQGLFLRALEMNNLDFSDILKVQLNSNVN